MKRNDWIHLGYRIFGLLVVALLLQACVATSDGNKVPIKPAAMPEFPGYHTILIRFSGDMEIQENLLAESPDDFALSIPTLARNTFKNTFLQAEYPGVQQFIFIEPEEIGLLDTILAEDTSPYEAISREGAVQLTPYAEERMQLLDIAGAFVLDIKRLVVEMNHKRKFGYFLTTHTGLGAIGAGPAIWLLNDYDLSISLEYSHITQDNAHTWHTLDPYEALAGDIHRKTMPHGVDFVDLKKKEIAHPEPIRNHFITLIQTYTGYALESFFGDANTIPEFKGPDGANPTTHETTHSTDSTDAVPSEASEA